MEVRLRERRRALVDGRRIDGRREGEAILENAIKMEVLAAVRAVTEDQTSATTIVIGFHTMRLVKMALVPTRSPGRNNCSFDGGGKISQDRFDIRRWCRWDH